MKKEIVEGKAEQGKTKTHIIQPSVRISVRNNLHGRIRAIRNVQPLRQMYRSTSDTKVLRALLLERRDKCDVEVGAGSITQSQQDLHFGSCVAHVELDRSAGKRPQCAVCADGVLAAAGEGTKDVFVEASRGWVDEFEVR